MHCLSKTKNNRQKSFRESHFWGKKRTNKLQDCYISARAHLPICKASYPSWSSLLSCLFAMHLQSERTGALKYINYVHIFISNSPAFEFSKALRPALPQAVLLKHLLTDWGPELKSWWDNQWVHLKARLLTSAFAHREGNVQPLHQNVAGIFISGYQML